MGPRLSTQAYLTGEQRTRIDRVAAIEGSRCRRSSGERWTSSPTTSPEPAAHTAWSGRIERRVSAGWPTHPTWYLRLNHVRPRVPILCARSKATPMTTLGVVLSVICGLIALVSASSKFVEAEPVVELLDHVQVTGVVRQSLPFVQIAGGLGALVGLFVAPWLGAAALAGLALYFLVAVGFHLRVGDEIAGFGGPLALAGIMAVAAVVRAATI